MKRNLLKTNSGFALILTMLVIVISTFLVTAFLSKTLLARKISNAQFNHYRSDLLARSAISSLVGDFRREIEQGSEVSVLLNGDRIYQPKNRWVQFPTKSEPNEEKALLKVSRRGGAFVGRQEFTSEDPFSMIATGGATDQPDINGKQMNREDWGRPLFHRGETPLRELPEWVLVGRKGIRNANDTLSLVRLSDPQSHNPDYVIGRMAYVVYDTSGLLNINEAGAPTVADAAFKAKRGGLAHLDLSILPGIGSGSLLADWRWKLTGSSLATLEKNLYQTERRPGMIGEGDRGWLNRQDLIQYARENSGVLSEKGLAFLTTFHQSSDVPSVIPDRSRPKAQGESVAKGLDDQINPSLFSVANPKGELTVKRRFPLFRISHLENEGEVEKIKKYFGLTKDATPYSWKYEHGNPQKILRLSEVAALGREPDFFETLKAAIWVGSLGKNLTPTNSFYISNAGATTYNPSSDSYHSFTDNQIVEIGLNLIDQWDQDSFPTKITFDGNEFFGSENLPGLYRIIDCARRVGGAAGPAIRLWYQPEIWNPYQNAFGKSTKGPSKLRVIATGRGNFEVWDNTGGTTLPTLTSVEVSYTKSDPGVEFLAETENRWREPKVLAPLNSNPQGSHFNNEPDFSVSGIYSGEITAPNGGGFTYSRLNAWPNFTFLLQYQVNNDWITYNKIDHMDRIGYVGVDFLTLYLNTSSRGRSDPRTARFGLSGSAINGAYSYFDCAPNGLTRRPAKSEGTLSFDPINGFGYSSVLFPGWSFAGPGIAVWSLPKSFNQGELSENTKNCKTRYADSDGTLRRADGGYVNGVTDAGYPQMANNSESRPVILNRPFRSVGEMGYAFRAMPWKSVDFFTDESADSALLDYFCIQENELSSIVPYQIALNTPHQEILNARIQGAIKKETDPSVVISKEQSEALAKKIDASIHSEKEGPFQNRLELVKRVNAMINYGNDDDNIIKTRREAAIRALANDSDTRTWNLMVDLVVQSGAYPKSAKRLNEFNVRGQTRYWVHLAIDRYTGKVLKTQYEKFYD